MDNTSLNRYLDEIGQQNVLTNEEETALSNRIKSGDERALQKLIEANLKFVVKIARQYQGNGVDIEDLISEGNIGLIKAASNFDANKGVRFINYAVVYIRRQMERVIDKHGGLFQIPKDVISESSLKEKTALSVDAPLGHKSNVNLLSVLINSNSPQADNRVYSETLEDVIEFAIGALDKRERMVVTAYYGIGMEHETMAEIAGKMELKRERVRQIRDKAVRKLRKIYKKKLNELK